ncbi:MAG: DUF4962 domain-containing protein [Acidobacteria bacterium]|nr:DUF4962 domain-containing protein [Acidobacteriota bacterium]
MKHAVSLLFLAALVAAAQAPDRAPLADEWGYRPADGAVTPVNPPSLSWVHEKNAKGYQVQWADNPGFARAAEAGDLPWTVYTHNAPLKPGVWYWRYRIAGADGKPSAWSRARRFTIPKDATVFPQPTMAELRARIPKSHPRLFVRGQDLPRLREWARGGGAGSYRKLLESAGALLTAEPTPEPTSRGDVRDPASRDHWWTNRVETIRAAQEVEVLSFVYLLTGEKKYGDAARRFLLKLTAWDPDGPTNFKLNCEAAKPLVHRLARGYDWAYDILSEDERARVRAMILRRGMDAWKSGEVREGVGHLNQPYNSHGNRTWHKLGENAVATFDETPEAEMFLRYAVTKFFAAYPAWSDDDGGWHEGLSYFAGYMGKTAWWMDFAQSALGIDGFKKPFFAHFGDYALYSAPPGTPDLGIGDLAYGRPGRGWAFMHFYVRRTGNPFWAWWLEKWNIPEEGSEPVLDFLWGSAPPVAAKPPSGLPPSKVFRGTGVAVLNDTLLDAAENVQIRFKASPMGRWSHGHDPHNSFTLNAYGQALLVNNVYRDLYGSPFHAKWVWTTRAQNAVLVNGEGQKPRSADLGGRIVKWQFEDGLDYVAGDAGASYEGRLKSALRHVVFVKPDVVVLVDELEAPHPSTFQWMLHAHQAFDVDQAGQKLTVNRGPAGVLVDYAAAQPLKMRQWTGYDPEPDWEYLKSVKSSGIPPQWHVEASSVEPATRALTLTVLRPYKQGAAPQSKAVVERQAGGVRLRVSGARSKDVEIAIRAPGQAEFARVRAGGKQWSVQR